MVAMHYQPSAPKSVSSSDARSHLARQAESERSMSAAVQRVLESSENLVSHELALLRADLHEAWRSKAQGLLTFAVVAAFGIAAWLCFLTALLFALASTSGFARGFVVVGLVHTVVTATLLPLALRQRRARSNRLRQRDKGIRR